MVLLQLTIECQWRYIAVVARRTERWNTIKRLPPRSDLGTMWPFWECNSYNKSIYLHQCPFRYDSQLSHYHWLSKQAEVVLAYAHPTEPVCSLNGHGWPFCSAFCYYRRILHYGAHGVLRLIEQSVIGTHIDKCHFGACGIHIILTKISITFAK